MKRVLLTGPGGFIASHTIAHILENTDWHVVGIDSFRHKGLTDRITTVLREYPQCTDRLTIYTHDLAAPLSELLIDEIGQIDYIINMASQSHVTRSIEHPIPFINNNIFLVENMLEYARVVKPEVFIQVSTDEVYGAVDVGTAHKEWESIKPSNPYSASKACQEAIAYSYWRSYDVPVVITNTMNNFGEMQDPEKYPAMLQRRIMAGETVTVHGSKDNIGSRFYLHARNHADALLFILQNTTPTRHKAGYIDDPDRYNVVGEKRIDNLELAQMIAKILDKPLKYELVDFHSFNPGHDTHYGLDGGKLEKLGWRAPVGLEDGLRRTLEWSIQHPQWLYGKE